MNLLLKQLILFEPTHPLHLQTCDVFIQEGVIQEIQPDLSIENAEIIEAKGCYLSIGWTDIGVQIGEPGYEHREDLASMTQAAAAGGFTSIASFPNTHPIIQSKSEINFLRQYATSNLVDILPIGAVTSATEGAELTEMYDMRQSGAIAFSDGKKSIQHTGVMLRALQYVKAFNGIIVNHPHDKYTAGEGQIHEGAVSTRLGMKGIPSLSEELMLQRDVELLDYADSKLHVHNVSTVESVSLIRRAKERGLKITASVSALHLAFTSENLEDFDTNFKVKPPLRTNTDQEALKKGLADETIDFITSNHVPLEEESKFLEFSYAKFGAIGLQTAFSSSLSAMDGLLSTPKMIEKWAYDSRKALELDIPSIKVGENANLTLFDPNKTWKVSKSNLYSKSKNSPFLGKNIKGKTILTINNGKIWKEE